MSKQWYEDGSIYIGQCKSDIKTEGKKYTLDPDGTHRLFKVKYDDKENEIEIKEINRGHKMTWTHFE